MAQTPETEQAGQLMSTIWTRVSRLAFPAVAAIIATAFASQAAQADQATPSEPGVPGGETTEVSLQAFDATIILQLPFKHTAVHPDYQVSNEKQSLAEYVPQGQSVDSWQDLVSVRGYQSLGLPNLGPEDVLNSLAQSGSGACPAAFVFERIAMNNIGALPAASSVTGCSKIDTYLPTGQSPGQSEMGVSTLVQIDRLFLEITYSKRGPSGANAFRSADDPDVQLAADSFLRTIVICKKRGKVDDCHSSRFR